MKAIRIHQQGDPDVMQLEEVDRPQPGAGQVLLRVNAAGINYIDTYQRSGQYKVALPFTPGQEAAGVVEAVGEGVSGFQTGDRAAAAFSSGCYADYVVVDAGRLIHLPDGVPDDVALAGLVQGMTAHYLSHDTYPLQPGETALVHAAAGGTGQLLVQMAKRRGARVLATVGSVEKAELARELGADEVINYRESDFEAEVRRLMDGRGVDVVYDSVGKDTFLKGLNLLRPRGMMVLYGQSSGAVEPLDLQVLNAKGSLFVTRPSLGFYMQTQEELLRRANDVFGWIADGSLRVRVDRTWPLAQVADAHRALTARETTGKLALIPSHD